MKKYLKWIILAMVIGCLAGCGSTPENAGEEEEKPNISEEQEKQNEADENNEEQKEDEKSNEDNVENETQSDVEITVYYTDDNGDIQSKVKTISEVTPENVWNAVKNENSILSDSEMISCIVDNAEKKIDLDLNRRFGEVLRSVGTSAENNMIAAVVNTYLEAFECEQIKISEEGGLLSSSHRDYDKYMEKR